GHASVPVFLSAFYATMDTTTGTLAYANAGHPAPLLVRRREGEVALLTCSGGSPGPPLGVRDQAGYAVSMTALAAGDVLMLYTDGLTEVVGEGQEPFGEDRLPAAVERRVREPTSRLFGEVLSEISRHSDGRGCSDDGCLVGMEVVA